MKKILRNNGLSIAFILLFLASMAGQVVFGFEEYNKEMSELDAEPLSMSSYLVSGHFLEATFENWESEFLQMGLFVVLTIFLQQKGSSESKDLDKEEEVDREPSSLKKNAPLPVKKGGWILKLYKHSLSISLFILFALSFVLHFYGSLKEENLERKLKSKPTENASDYLVDTKFWFESFQNWQSEFLSVFTIVALSVFLRQKGSPQSKPVDAPHSETGA